MERKSRRDSGNTLLIMALSVGFIVGPALVLLTQMSLHQVDRMRVQSILDAAGLIAANDFSRIVVNDKNFGYVSLSNYPPIGKGTIAADGEPLPVLGINTLVGTVRQNAILARELNNVTMEHLADRDRENMGETIKTINKTLSAAASGKSVEPLLDMQGARVDTVRDVTAFIESHLPESMSLQTVTISNGYLSEGGDSTVAVPKPDRLAQVRKENNAAGHYRAFSDIPAFGQIFTFAGLGASSTLVRPALFKPADDKHICSIVRVTCTVKLNKINNFLPFGLDSGSTIDAITCSQPFALPDSGPAGALTLRFTSGPVAGLQSWRDFLGGNFIDTKVTAYDVADGDYPTTKSAHMVVQESFVPPSTTQQFAEHFYYWLRNGHTRPNLDAVIAMVDDNFKSGPNQIYAYEFTGKGEISRRIISKDPFPIGVTSDSQMQTIADTSVQNRLTPIIIFRDDVATLGSIKGGLHAGQPLAGTPLNWCELPEYGGSEEMARDLNKGHLGTRLTLVDASGSALPEEAINNPNYALFQNFNGRTIFHQPRRSFYSGGLALDIEIGGTGDGGGMQAVAEGGINSMPLPQKLPPILDIPSKRWIFANRKI